MNRMLRIHLKETKYEFLKLLRLPSYSLPTLLFPVFFYLFFGVGFGSRTVAGVKMASYLIATYAAFGVIGAALFGFGVTVAVERGHGWLEIKRTTPMPISAYFISKMLMAMLFGAIIFAMLITLGTTLGGVSLTLPQIAALFGVLVSGAIPFCAMGLAVGYFASPSAAPAIVNIIYLPMGFLSGLWVPIWMLPKALQSVAFFLPPFHYSQLALRVIGAGRIPAMTSVIAMLIFTAAFVSLAYAGYRREAR